ncbi:IS66 family insertion sequence element accessory protein TnpA [Sansalvadorimonas verongulae]|uniref:IS66 family insertion sequence element accessory protein TnpA n=1 Tax=Sansalvadorimonas verongulae TaxID=2172824 RepID=UPI0012BBE1E2|nr:hypothetical protein [Sansalvadorimonas verongulae]MTI12674.1 hypothetical protein [Sansalvadorimonas verongulae]
MQQKLFNDFIRAISTLTPRKRLNYDAFKRPELTALLLQPSTQEITAMDPQRKFVRLNHEQWQHIIDQQVESGLSQKNFCQSRHITLATFSNWKRKLRNGPATRANA